MPQFDNRVLDRHFAEPFRARLPEEVLRRAKMLREPERTLFELLVVSKVSRRQIARMLNLPPGTISRRVHRLAARLHDPMVVALADDHCPLPKDDRQLAIEHFLQGQTVDQITGEHRISAYKVRERLAYVRGWHKGLTTIQRARSVHRAGSSFAGALGSSDENPDEQLHQPQASVMSSRHRASFRRASA